MLKLANHACLCSRKPSLRPPLYLLSGIFQRGKKSPEVKRATLDVFRILEMINKEAARRTCGHDGLTSSGQGILIASRHVSFIIGIHCIRSFHVIYAQFALNKKKKKTWKTSNRLNAICCQLVERELAYKLLTCSSPFSLDGKNNQQEISKRILMSDPSSKPIHLSDTMWDFITRLLIKDPRRRLDGGPGDAKELKHHPFFMDAAPDFIWEALEKKQIKSPIVPLIAHESKTSNFLDEFTKGPVTHMTPPIIDNNKIDWYFSNYLYIATSILYINNKVSRGIFSDKHQPSLSDLYSMRFEESTFFQTYELDQGMPPLGDGSFSICLQCRHRSTWQEYALIEVHHDRLHTYFVMELLTGGELSQRQRPFPELKAKEIMRQLLSAMRYMHESGIVHHDLKPENIVFANKKEDSPVKIVDFGFAQMKNNCELLPTAYCTLPDDADESCDMWSLGTILYFMLSREPPFRANPPHLANRITQASSISARKQSKTQMEMPIPIFLESYESLLQIAQDEMSVYRRHKAIKRLKRSPTIIVE
ncbi:hypothetical protein ACFW04_013822 [Cataglyphis niger]